MEVRFTSSGGTRPSLRTRTNGGGTIHDYAAVFHRKGDPGTEYLIGGLWRERIAPGAFDRALADDDDVRGLFNHNPDNLLGRVSAGTLTLHVDKRGLAYEIDVPDTTLGRDVTTLVERGDITGSSFAFIAMRDEWQHGDDGDVRTILEVRLYDVGPVVYPAYISSTAGVRAAGTLMRRHEPDQREVPYDIEIERERLKLAELV